MIALQNATIVDSQTFTTNSGTGAIALLGQSNLATSGSYFACFLPELVGGSDTIIIRFLTDFNNSDTAALSLVVTYLDSSPKSNITVYDYLGASYPTVSGGVSSPAYIGIYFDGQYARIAINGTEIEGGPVQYTSFLASAYGTNTVGVLVSTSSSATPYTFNNVIYYPTGKTGPTGPQTFGGLLRVDNVYGNDTLAAAGKYASPFRTVSGAISSSVSGDSIWVLPGTYNLSGGITIPTGIALRGANTQTTTIQMLSVATDTTLLTMGESTRVEDLTLKLTSSVSGVNLTGISFPGTTSVTAKLRTTVLTVDNSTVSGTSTSNVYGVVSSGTGSLTSGSFSFNSLKGSTINVYSNGGGNKRGILVNGGNTISTRDLNVYVAPPTTTTSTGSYVGVETNASGASIQLRSTTIGTFTTSISGTSSDILQTTPSSISDPTYLASAGIQIGPGVDLVTKTAGGKGFSTYNYPTTLYYGLRGNLRDGTAQNVSGWLWPGTMSASNQFPDTSSPIAAYRVQQPAILSGMSVRFNTAPGTGNTTTLSVQRTISGGTATTVSGYSLVFGATDTFKSYYSASQTFGAGDLLHLLVRYTGAGASNLTTDITAQVDLF
jgi:hypothetical protein